MKIDIFRGHFEPILVVVFDGRNSLGFEAFIDVDSGSVIDVIFHLLEEKRMNSAQPKLAEYFDLF